LYPTYHSIVTFGGEIRQRSDRATCDTGGFDHHVACFTFGRFTRLMVDHVHLCTIRSEAGHLRPAFTQCQQHRGYMCLLVCMCMFVSVCMCGCMCVIDRSFVWTSACAYLFVCMCVLNEWAYVLRVYRSGSGCGCVGQVRKKERKKTHPHTHKPMHVRVEVNGSSHTALSLSLSLSLVQGQQEHTKTSTTVRHSTCFVDLASIILGTTQAYKRAEKETLSCLECINKWSARACTYHATAREYHSHTRRCLQGGSERVG
jgi:hypothetical protein